MQDNLRHGADAVGGGLSRALRPFLTQQLFYGAAVSCVLGLALGFWVKPPLVEAMPNDTVQPVISQTADAGAWTVTSQPADWQVAAASPTPTALDSMVATDAAPIPVDQAAADQEPAATADNMRRISDTGAEADAEPLSGATRDQAGDEAGDAPPSRWPSVDGGEPSIGQQPATAR